MDLDAAGDRLYGLAPGEFVAARDALAKEAKTAGDAALSRRIAALRRPTVVGWAVNQAARRHLEELDELLDVGGRLREAWRRQDAEALAALTQERSAATARLARLIRQDAEAAGQPLSGTAGTEIEQTLDAAVVDETASEQVREGRLVRGLSYSGFAPAPVLRPVREAATPTGGGVPSRGRQAAPPSGERRRGDGEAAKERAARQKAERERREREKAAADARDAAARADEGLSSWEAELAEAVQDHDRLAEEVAELSGRLATAKDRQATARHRLDVARREESRSRRAAESARLRAARAEAALTDVPPVEG
ncbi:hypothetical protein GCM10023194_55020 [Planotetraspora phitsanulokensis]|uniref:Uncharacterized protein n=1 Tax=Planotetraspora phitsanulokensis TaxID=575192 RepID=A0A8J3UAH7_9ACTN|nr:hypothetical protein [Planotetraspora phitsanulokensis]GII41773.1 hypothetical protein Pph01_67760 [Planotetraspora phitsanulokensis]